jgi:hypothetical protein
VPVAPYPPEPLLSVMAAMSPPAIDQVPESVIREACPVCFPIELPPAKKRRRRHYSSSSARDSPVSDIANFLNEQRAERMYTFLDHHAKTVATVMLLVSKENWSPYHEARKMEAVRNINKTLSASYTSGKDFADAGNILADLVNNEIILMQEGCSGLLVEKVSSEEIKNYLDDLRLLRLGKELDFHRAMSRFCSNCSSWRT